MANVGIIDTMLNIFQLTYMIIQSTILISFSFLCCYIAHFYKALGLLSYEKQQQLEMDTMKLKTQAIITYGHYIFAFRNAYRISRKE